MLPPESLEQCWPPRPCQRPETGMKTAERPPCYVGPTALPSVLCWHTWKTGEKTRASSPHTCPPPTSPPLGDSARNLGGSRPPSKPWSALRAQGPSQGLTSKSLLRRLWGRPLGTKELPRHQVQRPQESLPFLGCSDGSQSVSPKGKAVQSPSPDQGSQEQTPRELVGDTVPENLPRRHRHCRWS